MLLTIRTTHQPATDLGFLQPAVKWRGREYVRIIYGLEYTLPAHLERLRVAT